MLSHIKLRQWQQEAHNKCLSWFNGAATQKHFVLNAAPGAGKTLCATMIAKTLIEQGAINRVIIIAPRSEVVRQWGEEFFAITGRSITKVTSSEEDLEWCGDDLSATWASVQGLADGFKLICDSSDTLVICDEHHHAAVKAAWGDGASSAFKNAKHVLILTGTPIRSDGEASVWMAYTSSGAIDIPADGSYTLSYGEAVELNYCRPATFHRHEGHFDVELENGQSVRVNGASETSLPSNLKSISGLKTALEFYRIASQPMFEDNSEKPDLSSYHASMTEWAINKLNEVRELLPNAGGLVIAPNIPMAEYFCRIIELLEGEKPVLVHSQMPNASNKIDTFRRSQKRWIVSVAMISEGVDIKRLRVLIYLPNSQTELTFRQAVGRVVRTDDKNDMSRAYVVMPAYKVFEKFARRIEHEMPPAKRMEQKYTKKVCPTCGNECEKDATNCSACNHEFVKRKKNFVECTECEHLIVQGSKVCINCGHEQKQKQKYRISLREALRSGVIARGMDISEEEAREGEKISNSLRADIISSGDEVLISILSKLPKESDARLARIFSKYK